MIMHTWGMIRCAAASVPTSVAIVRKRTEGVDATGALPGRDPDGTNEFGKAFGPEERDAVTAG
jgi:hypothetical protein